MKIFNKHQRIKKGEILTIYDFLGISLLLVRKSVSRCRLYLFGVKIFSFGFEFEGRDDFNKLQKRLSGLNDENLIVWFDHSLGGGTEVYSERRIDVIRKTNVIVRVQYRLKTDRFVVSVIDGVSCEFFILRSLLDLRRVLEGGTFNEIVVNNLVGYKDALAVLNLLRFLCSKRCLHITFNLHDFQCICPSFNLMYKGKEFCELSQKKCPPSST